MFIYHKEIFMYNFDYTYLIFVLPALLISMFAQYLVKSRFSKYNKIPSKKNITGAQAAKYLLIKNGITDVKIAHISGTLSDNYNPQNKTLSLSDSTFNSTSIAALGVAAHETGHAIQHSKKYFPLVLRRSLVPIANFGSKLGPTIAILGIILGETTKYQEIFTICQLITNIGLILFSGAVLFYLITLPVEFNASNRALKILKESNTLDKEELKGTKKVLKAAALTYVASALSAIFSLLRLIFISKSRKSRN